MKSLSDIKKRIDQANNSRSNSSGSNEPVFLKLKDGESVKLRFLQEFDKTGPSYDEHWGPILVVDEHQAPGNFKLRVVCSYEDEGKCWGCEQQNLPEIGYKWKPKLRLYANVAVDTPEGTKVRILASGFSDQAVGGDLFAFTEEFGSTMDREYKLQRTGSNLDTSYRLMPLGPGKWNLKGLEPIDATKFIKFLPYAEQAAYFSGETASEESTKVSDWLS